MHILIVLLELTRNICETLSSTLGVGDDVEMKKREENFQTGGRGQ